MIASPAVAVCRVLECIADPPPPSRDDDVPPYDALGRLLLAKHAMERTLVSDSAAIVLPDPRIVVDLLESVIRFRIWHASSRAPRTLSAFRGRAMTMCARCVDIGGNDPSSDSITCSFVGSRPPACRPSDVAIEPSTTIR